MLQSLFPSHTRRGFKQALCAGLVAGLVVLAFGISQATIVWGREAGFQAFDVVRLWSSAGLLGALPAALGALVAARLRAIEDRRAIAPLLCWSAPLAGMGLVVVATAVGAARPPVWLLPGGIALLAIIGWRGELFWKAPADSAPTGWLIAAAAFLFTALQWGAPTPDSKTSLAFVFIGVFVALWTIGLAAARLVMSRLSMPKLTGPVLTLGAVAVAAVLPWIFIDRYLMAELFVVTSAGFGAAYLTSAALFDSRKPWPRALSLGAAGLLTLTLLSSVWIFSLPVPERFGAFSRDSVVGLVWVAASAAQDADGDGFYAPEAGGNDPDDGRAAVIPPAGSSTASDESDRAPRADAASPTFDRAVDHVIIIVVDSLRADLLEDADKRAQFPFLDKLDAESVRFERAYAPSNRTRLSMAPMLTGIAPEVFDSIGERSDLYAQILDENWLGRATTGRTTERTADRPADQTGQQGGSALIISAPYAWMRAGVFEVDTDHGVIDPTTDENGHTSAQFVEHFDDLIGSGFFDRAPTVTASYVSDPHADHVCADGRRGGYDCYIEEVQLVDRALEQIYGQLERAGILDRSLLIVTADHGEGFGELNYKGHAMTLAEETIRVPLLMRFPDATHRRISAPVSLTALASTATDALHVDPVTPQLYASLLGHLAADGDAPDDPVSVDNPHDGERLLASRKTALIIEDRKLTYDWYTTHKTLVDLDEPLEAGSDLARREPETVERMVERLFDWRRQALELGQTALPE